MAANHPAYNLKAVIHETGLTPATLRAWERRYGVPKPQRSAGGHRLYSLEEIEMLKWLVARQAEGLSISQAIELWRSQGPFPPPKVGSSLSPRVDTGSAITMLDQLREQWIAACLAFDEPAAELALSQSLALAASEVVLTDLLQKGLAQLGEDWYAGKVSVQRDALPRPFGGLAGRSAGQLWSLTKAGGGILRGLQPGSRAAAWRSGAAHFRLAGKY